MKRSMPSILELINSVKRNDLEKGINHVREELKGSSLHEIARTFAFLKLEIDNLKE